MSGSPIAPKVLRFARPYRGAIAALAVVAIFGSVVGLINPFVYRTLINAGILGGDSLLVVKLAALAAGIAVIEAALAFAQRIMAVHLGLRIYVDLGRSLFERLQAMPVAFFGRAKTGPTVSRLDEETHGVSDAFSDAFPLAVSSVFTVSLTLIAMFVLSWQLALASLLLVPAFVIPAGMIGRRVRLLARERLVRNGEKKHFAIEKLSVAGALAAKIFGRPADDLETFVAHAIKVRDVRFKANMYSSSLSVGLALLASLAVAALYGWGGSLAAANRLDVGTLVALATYLLRLSGLLTGLGNLNVVVLNAVVSFERVFEVLELSPLVKEAPDATPLPPGPARIEFQSVSFRYPSATEVSRASFESVAELTAQTEQLVLRDISFTVKPGQLIALVGGSGAGKTTAAQLIARLYDPTSGSVRINGCDLRAATLESIRSTVGIVTQEAHFFHDTVRANLLYAKPDATDPELAAALREAQILPVIESLPQGMNTVIGERGHRLSGGEKQRLAIARVLLKSPRVVILDEATAHLDATSERAVQIAFQAALAGRTSVVIAHRLSTVRKADHIIVLEKGAIAECGCHKELLELGGAYEKLYRTQFWENELPSVPPQPAPMIAPVQRNVGLGVDGLPHRFDSSHFHPTDHPKTPVSTPRPVTLAMNEPAVAPGPETKKNSRHGDRHPLRDGKTPEVSIIIPVRNNVEGLRTCLDAMQRQTFGCDRFEIIVVDNGSESDFGPIQAEYPDVQWLYESRPGSYCARNNGYRHASGAIIAFTDSDCVPMPDWLENAVRILDTSATTIIGGRIEFIDPVGRKLNVYEIIEDEMFDMVNHQRVVETQHFAMTANLVTSRAVMERVGLFDGSFLSSGDREWGQQAVARGEVLTYAHTVAIQHPRRDSFLEICRKLRRVVGGKVQLAKKRRAVDGVGPVIHQLYGRSVFNLAMYRFAFRCQRVIGPWQRFHLMAALMALLAISTVEGGLVTIGKKPHRG